MFTNYIQVHKLRIMIICTNEDWKIQQLRGKHKPCLINKWNKIKKIGTGTIIRIKKILAPRELEKTSPM